MKKSTFIVVLCTAFSSLAKASQELSSNRFLKQEQIRLVDNGDCKESDFLPPNGWKKSIFLPKPNTYYIHCGPQRAPKTFYFKIESEQQKEEAS